MDYQRPPVKSIRTDPTDGAPEGDERRVFELWRRVEPSRPGYEWMVWELGPMTGAEHWFVSEDAAREYMALNQSAATHGGKP